MPKYLNFNSITRDDGRTLLPILEFAVGSLNLSKRQALIEIGFPEETVDDLMERRLAEDLVNDPRVKRVMQEEIVRGYAKESYGQSN